MVKYANDVLCANLHKAPEQKIEQRIKPDLKLLFVDVRMCF